MRRSLGFLLFICLLVALSAAAQNITGIIQGTVTDAQGAAVPNAQVTIKNIATGETRTVTASGQGIYTAPELSVGTYDVTIKQPNFKTFVSRSVAVDPSSTATVNAVLEVGSVNEEVTVMASAIQVETNTGTVSNVVEGNEVRELPLNGSNFVELTQLMPGVSPASFFNTEKKGLEGGVDFSVNGNSVTSNLFLIDGVNNNDIGSNRTILIYPSTQAIEEFKMLRNSYGPEYGQAAGAIINIVTKGGTNSFHGGGFYRGRNTALNATDYFNNLNHIPKDVLHRNDYGFNIGGPIVKDKLFFFESEEWNKEIRGKARTGEVPTAAEAAGDFSNPRTGTFANGSPCDPTPWSNSGVLDSNGNGYAFNGAWGNNLTNGGPLSPAGLLMVQTFPAPNLANPVNCANWGLSLGAPIPWREDNVRIDFHATRTFTVFGRYTNDSWKQPFPSTLSYWGDDIWPGVESSWAQPSRQATIKLTKLLGSTSVNDFQVSFAMNRIIITRAGNGVNGMTPTQYVQAVNTASPTYFPTSGKFFGINEGQPLFWNNGIVGGVGISGGSGGFNNMGPWHNNEQLLILKDDYSKVAGSHTFKVGFLATNNQKNELVGNASAENAQYWSTAADGWGGPTDCTSFSKGVGTTGSSCPSSGNGIYDMLYKGTQWGGAEQSTNNYAQMRWHDFEFYGGDTWKARRNLTLEYGLRWSFLRNAYTGNDHYGYFNPIAYDPVLAGTSPCNGMVLTRVGLSDCAANGFPGGKLAANRSIRDNNNHLVQPRIGFAWDVRGDGKTAIRGGFGTFYLRDRVGPLEAGTGVPPFVLQLPGAYGQRTLDAPNSPFIVGGGAPSRGIQLKNTVPSAIQYNLTIEREMFRNSKLELAYVANKGRHLVNFADENQVPAASRVTYAETPAGSSANSLRPFGGGSWGTIPFYEWEAESNYDALQALFRTRLKGVDAQFAYTWGHSLGNTDITDSSGGQNNQNSFLDSSNPRGDYGNSSINRPHIFVGNIVYNLPALTGHNGFLRYALGSWELASILSYASGPSLTVFAGSSGAPGGLIGDGFSNSERPDRVAGVSCRASGSGPLQWLNPGAFTLDHYALGSYPTSSRGVCLGPGIAQTDFSVAKNFKATERVNIKFSLDFFNLFNKAQFRADSIGTTLSSGGTLCDAASPCAGYANDTIKWIPAGQPGAQVQGGFGLIGSDRGPREIQYGLRIEF